jgi:hypothetical protein
MRYGLLLSVVVIVCGAFTTGRVLSDELPSDGTAAELYARHYASCHGKDGRAKTFKAKFNQARNLTDPAWHDSER